MDKKHLGMILSTVCLIVLILLLGPVDIFRNGYYCDVVDFDQVIPEDFTGRTYFENEDYTMQFSPQKRNFAGFELILLNQPEGNTGTLVMEIYHNNGEAIDTMTADLSKISAVAGYRIYTNTALKQDEIYTLKISVRDCDTVPYCMIVSPDYLPGENVSGDLLIGYVYTKSTFTAQNKFLISLFLISVWAFLCGSFLERKKQKYMKCVSVFVFLTAMLSWNYMYNSMDDQNEAFDHFQEDSETYVYGMIAAEHRGVALGNVKHGYGLGRYTDAGGKLESYDRTFLSDEEWEDGYSKTEPAIIINSNNYTRDTATIGNYIAFANGEMYRIQEINDNGKNMIVSLDGERRLTSQKQGSLSDILFYNENQERLEQGRLEPYESSYGLQGKIFRHLARFMEYDEAVINLHLLCSIAAAVVFVLLVFILAVKYNKLLAGCFLAVFWLSPWVVNFAGNLYWVEFTWFLPMLAGLICAWKVEDKKYRRLCHIAVFITVAGKCLCGYEYISTIMMGMIAFLLADFFLAIIKKEKEKSILLFKTVFVMGSMALAGFVTAICIHALLKGEGNMMEGIRNIYTQDVLRRTSVSGAGLNEFPDWEYQTSLNASVWETCSRYFHFPTKAIPGLKASAPTEIMTGLAGNLFPLLCLAPFFIFAYEYSKKRLNIELLLLDIIFFLTPISWFCLAKGHSYEHPHMNYVLWYFGFIQICIYIVLCGIMKMLKDVKETDG